MNYQVFLDRVEEEDKKKIPQVTFDGQTIFFSSYIYKLKFEANNSILFLTFIFLHYLSIFICNIIIENTINSTMIIEYLVFSSSFFLHAC